MKTNKQFGFTLIELLIVVAIIAILAALAINSYRDSVRKTRRARGVADMIALTNDFERFYTANNTYVGYWTNATLVPASRKQSPNEATVPFYTIAASNITQTTYTLTATAQVDQVNDICDGLAITQTGLKSVTEGTVGECWGTR
ncbi:type IV pilin protein [Arenimonas oryziterrae]|uniref:Pilus assembly protein PilE n=1 Tax=Arenimonas oryziterrae DSM 21050 = YC6267 TaxID=1121015 RepID=A0A091AZX3_9GAMM|nr:type IV pilin protein [Arenimonas oryziterrae]KFN44961.1 hypothetical protein N789_02785 [Arenimonas oryziterrae DSM 21050 = YC6267]